MSLCLIKKRVSLASGRECKFVKLCNIWPGQYLDGTVRWETALELQVLLAGGCILMLLRGEWTVGPPLGVAKAQAPIL